MGQIYIISGDDDFARKQRAREIAITLTNCENPEDSPDLEAVMGDNPQQSAEETAAKFLNSFLTPPFLADRKILWLRHFPDLELLAGAKEESVCARIARELVSGIPDYLDVIIDGPNLDLRKTFAKQLKSSGAVMESRSTVKSGDRNYTEIRKQDIVSWAQKKRKQLDADALQYITEAVASTGGTLQNELEKLDCYTGQKPLITLEDCRQIISRTPEAVAWQFTSAVVSGNRKAALLQLGMLMNQSDSEIRVLSQLSGEFQKMMQTRLAMAELNIKNPSPRAFETIPEEIRQAHPKNPLLKLHPFRAFKICESAAGISKAGLAFKLNALRDAARKLVSGGGDKRIIMEQLVIQLTEKQS